MRLTFRTCSYSFFPGPLCRPPSLLLSTCRVLPSLSASGAWLRRTIRLPVKRDCKLQLATDGSRRRTQPRPDRGPETVDKAECVGVCLGFFLFARLKALKVKTSH